MDQIVPGWLSIEELVRHRMESFHHERVRAIADGTAPFPLVSGGKLVVHLIPEESICSPKRFTALELKAQGKTILPFGRQSGLPRYNLDGFATFDGSDEVKGYSQLFRDGRSEAVTTNIVYERYDRKLMRRSNCEMAVIKLVEQYCNVCNCLSISSPVWVFAALVDCKGIRVSTDEEISDEALRNPISYLPSHLIESFGSDPATQLRPLFDCLANAVGLERSPDYDVEGKRKIQRNY